MSIFRTSHMGSGRLRRDVVARRSAVAVAVAVAVAFLVPVAPTGAQAAPADDKIGVQDAPDVDNIVGGTASTDIADFPHIVSVGFNGAPSCGGALITPTWVMTAAHCFFDATGTQTLFSGDITAALNTLKELPFDAGAEERISDVLIVHPGYNHTTNENDIALFQLTIPSAMTPTGLGAMSNLSEWSPGDLGTVKGWGTLSSGGLTPGELHEVKLPIVSDAACETSLPGAGSINPTLMMCAGDLVNGGIDSCQGDSGGPLSVPNLAGGWFTVGVVSFGFGCADVDSPGVYTEVAAYRTWIAANVPSLAVLELNKTADVATVQAGGEITYTLTATNFATADQTSVVVTDVVPTGTTYVAGSAECGGVLSSGVLTFNIGTLNAGQSQSCSFTVLTDANSFTELVVDDGFEPDASAWTTRNPVGAAKWALDAINPHTGSNAMFATNPSLFSDQYLTLTTPVAITATMKLKFWHRYELEDSYDGGVVEISINSGGTWEDLGSRITENGYNDTIDASLEFGNPIKGRDAFTGSQPTYIETVVDLSEFAGSTAQIRFRVGSDGAEGAAGWRVDDVRLGTFVNVTNMARASSATLMVASQTVVTNVVEPQITTPAGYTAVGPDRAVDTRLGGGSRVAAGSTLTIPVGTQYAGKSISVNLTVTGALANGFATLYACDQAPPATSSLNYRAGQAIANGVITKVSAQGTVCVFLNQSAHVVLDVFGVFPS